MCQLDIAQLIKTYANKKSKVRILVSPVFNAFNVHYKVGLKIGSHNSKPTEEVDNVPLIGIQMKEKHSNVKFSYFMLIFNFWSLYTELLSLQNKI